MNSWTHTVYGNRTGEVIDFIRPPSPTDICNSTLRLCAPNPIRVSSPRSIKSSSQRTDLVFNRSDPLLNAMHLWTLVDWGTINTSFNPRTSPYSSISKSHNGYLYLLPNISFSKDTVRCTFIPPEDLYKSGKLILQAYHQCTIAIHYHRKHNSV